MTSTSAPTGTCLTELYITTEAFQHRISPDGSSRRCRGGEESCGLISLIRVGIRPIISFLCLQQGETGGTVYGLESGRGCTRESPHDLFEPVVR